MSGESLGHVAAVALAVGVWPLVWAVAEAIVAADRMGWLP